MNKVNPKKLSPSDNRDSDTVKAFSAQWSRFEGMSRNPQEVRALFDRFFDVFPWDKVTDKSQGFEMGCGTGRFAQFVAPKVGKLFCVDPAPDAIRIAKKMLEPFDNTVLLNTGVGSADIGDHIPDASMDFGYSYGVLHHVPDTQQAIHDCSRLLKPGAPFLIYLYYRFDNRPVWFSAVWRLSDVWRKIICKCPLFVKNLLCDISAATIYWPLAKIARVADLLGVNIRHFPLSDFQSSTFARMRSNSRDRLGTPLEQRFTRKEIEAMLNKAGIHDVTFKEGAPYWCAVGIKS